MPEQHSEPWRVKRHQFLSPEILADDGRSVSDRVFNGFEDRLVACINACKGIPTERLGLLDSLIREAKILAGHCRSCGGKGKANNGGDCFLCGPTRSLLAKLEEKPCD